MTIPTQSDQQQAKETLAFIRQTMESVSTFTPVSGWGLVACGAIGLVAAWLAWAAQVDADIRVWIPAAAVSVVLVSVANAQKARRLDVPVWSGAFRRMVWVMTPPILAGALLTFALDGSDARQLLPGIWLTLYGAGVTAGAIFSVRAIRWMGMAFLVLGAVALFAPGFGLVALAAGFGGLHILIGLDIVWRHGG